MYTGSIIAASVLNLKMLEVCIDSLESAVNASKGGATYLEVCSSLSEGGLTPSVGLLKVIRETIPNIKLNVMLRCRSGSDFIYLPSEMAVMVADLEILKSYGADGFVFGALNSDGLIDHHNCSKIIEASRPLPVTFHRAFDFCHNPGDCLETIIKAGFSKLLTSGQEKSAALPTAICSIRKLIEQADKRITIMPGAGINVKNLKHVMETGAIIYHGSFRKIIVKSVSTELQMGFEKLYVTDELMVKEAINILGTKV